MGIEATTTLAVARRAGMSVGSSRLCPGAGRARRSDVASMYEVVTIALMAATAAEGRRIDPGSKIRSNRIVRRPGEPSVGSMRPSG